jgi:hypothetical protein
MVGIRRSRFYTRSTHARNNVMTINGTLTTTNFTKSESYFDNVYSDEDVNRFIAWKTTKYEGTWHGIVASATWRRIYGGGGCKWCHYCLSDRKAIQVQHTLLIGQNRKKALQRFQTARNLKLNYFNIDWERTFF